LDLFYTNKAINYNWNDLISGDLVESEPNDRIGFNCLVILRKDV